MFFNQHFTATKIKIGLEGRTNSIKELANYPVLDNKKKL
jgi:hypothetical protein